jgi:hypothetical protein
VANPCGYYRTRFLSQYYFNIQILRSAVRPFTFKQHTVTPVPQVFFFRAAMKLARRFSLRVNMLTFGDELNVHAADGRQDVWGGVLLESFRR